MLLKNIVNFLKSFFFGWYFRQKEEVSLGKPIFMLEISLLDKTKTFKSKEDGQSLFNANDQIEMWGLAINCAKTHLVGTWCVTDKGYLTANFVKELCTFCKAIMDIDDSNNVSALVILGRMLRKEINDCEERPHAHVHIEGIPSKLPVLEG